MPGLASSRRSFAVLPLHFAFLTLLAAVAPAPAGTSNSLLDISADGQLLVCANRDNGTVTVVDLASRAKRHEVPVGRHTEGVSFLGSTHKVAATAHGDDRVVFLDADAGKALGSLDVFDEPYGVVSNADGSKIYVTLEYPGQVLEIDAAARKVLRTFSAGSFLRGIALGERQRRLYVTEFLTGLVKAVDLESGKVVDTWTGTASDNLARQIALHPSRPKAYVPHIRARVSVPEGTGSIFPLLSVLDLEGDKGRNPLPMDSFSATTVVANPWEVAVAPDGKRLYAVFSGTDDMYVCDVLDDNYRELSLRQIVRLGHNPRAVRVAPDNKTFYVSNTLDFQVAVFDAQSLRSTGTIKVCDNPLGEEIRRGKELFYTALQPMVGRRWISCSSCHPDGEPDGRTWHNPEGLRNTPPLGGLAWTHPLHWSADRDESQDFEHTIRSPLMQGRGLTSSRPFASLEKPNKGVSTDLDALAAYTNSHHVSLSPHGKGGLSPAARRGKEIFFAKETRCAECHSGPYYTDSQPTTPFRVHDVGTGNDDPSEKMGPKYDTPTLLSLYRTAPYLHHGKAKTLTDVLTTFNAKDRHGKTSHLSSAQIADLVEFLQALPYEDPEPLAQSARLKKVER